MVTAMIAIMVALSIICAIIMYFFARNSAKSTLIWPTIGFLVGPLSIPIFLIYVRYLTRDARPSGNIIDEQFTEEPSEVIGIRRNFLFYLDIVGRFIAFTSLIPFAFIVLGMAAMATDQPSSGITPGFIVIGIAAIPIILIAVSCLKPDALAKYLHRFGKSKILISRLPAYFFALFTIFYAHTIYFNILKGVINFFGRLMEFV